MANFTFKLDPLLRARKHHERLKQRAVAAVEAERRALEEDIRRRQQRLAATRQDLRDQLTGTLHAQDLRLYANAALHELRRAQRSVIELAGVHKRLDAARDELREAARHRQVVERLRERRYHEWRTALDKAEVDELDELSDRKAANQR